MKRKPTRHRTSFKTRRGAILLIVLGLLSLFMLITISFVLEAGHERRGARAAANVEQQGDPPDTLLNMAMSQVIRGPRSPNSVIGPHSLLEDMYGEYDSVVGAIAQDGANGAVLPPRLVMAEQFVEITGIGFGPDQQPGAAGVDDDSDGIVDDVSEAPLSTTKAAYSDDFRLGQMPYVAGSPAVTTAPGGQDAVEGYYAGRVLTMLNGSCAKLSTRVVRYFQTNYNAKTGLGAWVLWIEPFKTVPVAEGTYYTPLAIGDTFVINGRPFNGAGFGYDPTVYLNQSGNQRYGQPDTSLSWSSLSNPLVAPPSPSLDPLGSGFPFALTPNPTDQMYRDYLNDRPYLNPISGALMPVVNQVASVDADEDYDAPDFQNMMLAHRGWIPASPTVGAAPGTGSWQVNIPSLHRPELVDYWMRAYLGANPASTPWSALPAGEKQGSSFAPRLRQRIMLRPDPNDHVYQDINPHNGRWDVGEPNWSSNSLFNPISGPWDVDNDNDGSPDSIWVDLGAPVQTSPDGTQFKPLFAILCLDMDGRLNVNAHGNSTQYTFANPTGAPNFPFNNPQYTPQAHPNSLIARTDEANVVGLTRYHGNAIPPGGSWPVPIPLNGPYAASAPANPSVSNAADYVYTQQPNSFEPSFPSFPAKTAGNTVGWNKQVGVGLGFSVAEINLAPVLGMNPSAENGYPNNHVRSSRVRWMFEGRYEGYSYPQNNNFQRAPIVGRYGEPHLNTAPNNSYKSGEYVWPRPRAGITGNQTAAIMSGALPNSTGDDNVPAAVTGASAAGLLVPGSVAQPMAPGYTAVGSLALGQPGGNYYQNSMVGGNGNATTLSVSGATLVNPAVQVPGFTGPSYTSPSSGVTFVRQGYNASPIDPNGRLMPGLDLRGQPLYGNMPSIVYPSNELIDDPWELDLSDSAARTGLLYTPQNFPRPSHKFEIDKPFAAADLETILRYADIDTFALAQRAENLFEMNASDPQSSVDFRNRVTTESWDIPVPNLIAPPEMMVALRSYGLPTNNLTFGDLVRGKILAAYLTVQAQGGPAPPANVVTLATQYAQTLLGCNMAIAQNVRDRYRAIPPDLLLGLRADLNRPLGNGIDDNGNGTVDEPLEFLQGLKSMTGLPASGLANAIVTPILPEPMWKSTTAASMLNGIAMDLNNDGFIYLTDALARQELAKNLYTLMMLVTDLKWTVAYPTIDNLPNLAGANTQPTSTPVPLPPLTAAPLSPAAAPTPREILHAYRVAQWAVNVVDFRDRDAIMTWFEFDIRPFYHDSGAVAGLGTQAPPQYTTWEVDGILSTGNAAPLLSNDDVQPYRGLVWGMEYPDLLITETTAFHDKALADSAADSYAANKHAMGQTPSTPAHAKAETTWDQIRQPQGSLFIELYCTGRPNTPGWPSAANAPTTALGSTGYNPHNYPCANLPYYPPELYDVTNPITFPTPLSSPAGMNYRQGALNLSKTGPGGVEPVWRIAITTPAGINNTSNAQAQFQQHPDSFILQPHVIGSGSNVNALMLESSIWNNYLQAASPQTPRLTTKIDRVAYFLSFLGDTNGFTANGVNDFYYQPPKTQTPGLPALTTPSHSANPPSPNDIFLQPGCYAVVGPYRGPDSEAPVQAGSPNNVTFIGYVDPSKQPSPSYRKFAQYINLQSQTQSATLANMVYPLINHATTNLTATDNNYPSTAAGAGVKDAKIKFPLGIPLGCPSKKSPTTFVGLNISEPNGGYSSIKNYVAPSKTTKYTTGSMSVTVKDTWEGTGGAGGYPDTPFDAANNRLGGAGLPSLSDGTTIDCCTVLLQRMADPTMGLNNFTNPYITVDWMNVDLTVFNGQQSYLDGKTQTLVSGPDNYTTLGSNGASVQTPFNFQTRQRGPRVPPNSLSAAAPSTSVGKALDSGVFYPQVVSGTTPYAYGWAASLGKSYTANNRNDPFAGPNTGKTNYGIFNGLNEAPLWSSMSDDPQPTPANGQTSASANPAKGESVFNHYLYSTLGFLNEGYGLVNANGASPGAIDGYFVNSNHATNNYKQTNQAFNVLYDYVGDPIRPFPWLTWNNRPYANPMELLLVPASSPERFGWEFTYKTHYTDGAAARLLGQSYPQYRLFDNHYAPMRSPNWDFFSATQIWGAGSSTAAGAAWSLQPVAAIPQGVQPVGSPRANIASSQTAFPPVQFDPTIGFANNLPYQGVPPYSATSGPPFDPPNVSFLPLVGVSTSGSAQPKSGVARGGYPFGHLLNFFQSSTFGPSSAPLFAANWPMVDTVQGSDALASIPAPNYFRLFEFVTVPSPFSGTENVTFPVQNTGPQAGQPNASLIQAPQYGNAGITWPPTNATAWPLNNAGGNSEDIVNEPVKAPFNRVSRFREPGRVNLNTISDKDVSFNANGAVAVSYNDRMGGAWPSAPMWEGITNDFPNCHQHWYDMRASMSVIDPRGPDRLWNTADDSWQPNMYNLYGIGQPASVNSSIQNSLYYANGISQSLGLQQQLGPLSVAMPTIYTNPFRSYCNPLRAPMAGMLNRLKLSPATGNSPSAAPLLFVDATMLRRSDPDVNYGSEPVFTLNTYGWGSFGTSPLPSVSSALGASVSGTGGTVPTQTASLLAAAPTPQAKINAEITSSYNDPNRNPFFRYYPLQKIGASTTTRSNVYAVWVTVGYFEVQKIPANPQQLTVDPRIANPDGFQLVRELHSDTGGAKRNRGFFIFDRSIPVGFQRGESLNVDKAILLRRIIQ